MRVCTFVSTNSLFCTKINLPCMPAAPRSTIIFANFITAVTPPCYTKVRRRISVKWCVHTAKLYDLRQYHHQR